MNEPTSQTDVQDVAQATPSEPQVIEAKSGIADRDFDELTSEAKASARHFWQQKKRRRRFERLTQQRARAEKRKKPARSYSSRVTAAFALTAAMTVLVLVSILGIVWEGQFQAYTRENIERIANSTANSIARNYAESHEFSDETLAPASTTMQFSNGLVVQVLNNRNGMVFDGTKTLADIEGIPPEDLRFDPQNDQAVSADIVVNDQTVGIVRVWPLGSSSMFTQYDAQFRLDSYRAVAIAAVIAVIIALFIGFVFARNLVDPLRKLTDTALKVKEGDFTVRTGLSGADEISQLGETFDAMVESMQKERIHERRLTTDVAHELRTPLMAIQATVEGMLDGVLPADSRRLSTLDSETRRLSRLVSALLELSKLESGSIPFEFTRLNLTRLIGGLVESQRDLFDASEIALEFDADPDVVVVADSDKLRQATVNLISNAVRYTDEGGHVRVEVRQLENGEACISVADDGIGIDDKDLKRVFSRFWRADEARNRESGGLGVGLAVVSEIVSRHKGRVDVESTPGEGTTFYLYIPNEPPEDDRKKKQSRGARSKPGGHSKKTFKARQKQLAKEEGARQREEEARRKEEAARRREVEEHQRGIEKLREARLKEEAKVEALARKRSRSQAFSLAKQVDQTLRGGRARTLDIESQQEKRVAPPVAQAPQSTEQSTGKAQAVQPVKPPATHPPRKPQRRRKH